MMSLSFSWNHHIRVFVFGVAFERKFFISIVKHQEIFCARSNRLSLPTDTSYVISLSLDERAE